MFRTLHDVAATVITKGVGKVFVADTAIELKDKPHLGCTLRTGGVFAPLNEIGPTPRLVARITGILLGELHRDVEIFVGCTPAIRAIIRVAGEISLLFPAGDSSAREGLMSLRNRHFGQLTGFDDSDEVARRKWFPLEQRTVVTAVVVIFTAQAIEELKESGTDLDREIIGQVGQIQLHHQVQVLLALRALRP